MKNDKCCRAHSSWSGVARQRSKKGEKLNDNRVIINVSGRYFKTDSSIFERFPGMSFLLLISNA